MDPHPQTDLLRSLEISGQRKLFRVARQDDEHIRTRPDLAIRIFDAADFICWSIDWLWSRTRYLIKPRRNRATAVRLRRCFRLE